MKKLSLLLITMTLAWLALFLQPRYVTKIDGYTEIADFYMASGKYYFRCQDEYGYLIKKTKPVLDISKFSDPIEVKTIDAAGDKELINQHIHNSTKWKTQLEYKSTELMMTHILGADLFTYSMTINGKEYVALMFYDPDDDKVIRKMSVQSKQRAKKIGLEHMYKSYDQLVDIARHSCPEVQPI